MRAEAAEKRTKKYLDRAAERGTKRGRGQLENTSRRRLRMDGDTGNAPNYCSSSSGSAGIGVSDRWRKAEAEHLDCRVEDEEQLDRWR